MKIITHILFLCLLSLFVHCAHKVKEGEKAYPFEFASKRREHFSFDELKNDNTLRIPGERLKPGRNEKAFPLNVEPIRVFSNWGYITWDGLMIMDPHFRENRSFFSDHLTHEMLPDFNYAGPWWDNLIKSLE